MKKKSAFTLAEVLITLGIIGIVAAMTLPNVLRRFQERAYLSQFQKVYTTISQAYASAAQEYGTASTWTDAQMAYDYMKPYLKISEDCPLKVGCFADVNYKTIRGIPTNYNPCQNSTWRKVRLSDGVSIAFNPPGMVTLHTLYIDVNGNATPNQFGVDTFLLKLTDSKGAPKIIGYDAWADERYCNVSVDTAGWGNGWSCSIWVLKNWNMNYLHGSISHADWIK